MYPLEEELTYPRQQWWVAAKSSEVGRELLQRTLLEEDVVFYRTLGGEVVALAARCPHRLYPLAKGKLNGDSIECGYHGFTFGASGRCVHIPTQDKVPESMRVRRYPTAEWMGWVWIWMGDPAQADAALLPKPECAGPGWDIVVGHMQHIKARYTLLIDNLFDLSHVAFVHASLLAPDGQRPAGFDIPPELTEVNGVFRTVRRVQMPYEHYATLLFGPGSGPMEVATPSDYHGPALTVTGSQHTLSPDGAGPLASQLNGLPGGSLRNLHGITPETRTTTHYFSGFSRNFRQDDVAFSRMYVELDRQVREQDVEALALIEPAAARARLADEQSALQDAGGIRVRRLLAQQIKAELAASR